MPSLPTGDTYYVTRFDRPGRRKCHRFEVEGRGPSGHLVTMGTRWFPAFVLRDKLNAMLRRKGEYWDE